MTKEKSIDIATQAGIVERGMEAYKAAKERGWVGLSDERLMEMPKQEQGELVAWVDLLKDAEQIIKDKFLYKRFIDGTPLSNDIPCWMVDFAQKYATPQPKQKQGEFVANDPLPRACNLAGVDYQTFLKIKTYMPLYTTPQPKEWVGLTEYEIKGVLGLSESWVGEDCSIPDMIGFAKAIQAKSKEKNYVVFGK